MQQEFTHARPFNNTLPVWRIGSNDTPHGILTRIDGPNGTASIFTPIYGDNDIPGLRRLAASIEAAEAKIAEIFSDTIPSKSQDKMTPVLGSLKGPFQAARAGLIKEADSIALDQATAIQLPATYDQALAQHALNLWAGLKHGERLQAVQDWPDYAIQSVARSGQFLSGLSPDEFKAVNLRTMEFNIRKRIDVSNHSFATMPNPDSPLARGLDPQKIRSHVEDQIRITEMRHASLQKGEQLLKDVIVFVAVALNIHVQNAWDVLNGTDA